MGPVTGKRKRDAAARPPPREASNAAAVRQKHMSVGNASNGGGSISSNPSHASKINASATMGRTGTEDVSVQIVTGSYERVLHGVTATIPAMRLLQKATTNGSGPDNTAQDGRQEASFSDTFLFAAHASSLRCLAISPPTEADKRILATGGSDERINLYNISTAPPSQASRHSSGALPSLAGTAVAENSRNRSLGSLIHHDRAITRLAFPAKGKLFSAAEDNTIAISRTRDWTVLSSIKAPIPKPQGRPSGDTAAPGEVPAGVNDFAIHPSQKLMLSVGRGERCMRLWNLMTGKKAGVLNFSRDLLSQVGEGRYGSGEGRRVLWDAAGENYVVGFERGAVAFGIDSQPKAVIRPRRRTKFHQMHFLPGDVAAGILAVSTEEGSIQFYSLDRTDAADDAEDLPYCSLLGQIDGREAGVTNRVKDFAILQLPNGHYLVIAGSSDGAVRLWLVSSGKVEEALSSKDNTTLRLGELLGTRETGNRITCLDAFVMDGKASAEQTGEASIATVGAGEGEDGSSGDSE